MINKKVKYYGVSLDKYAVSKKKIYFRNINPDTEKKTNMVMKTSGKSKKKTSTAVKMKRLKTNKKGYQIVEKFDEVDTEEDYCFITKYYLKKPGSKKLIFLREVRE